MVASQHDLYNSKFTEKGEGIMKKDWRRTGDIQLRQFIFQTFVTVLTLTFILLAMLILYYSGGFFAGAFLLLEAWLAVKIIDAMFFSIQEGFVGIEVMLGWRTGVVCLEGPTWIIPWITKIIQFTRDIKSTDFTKVVTTKIGEGKVDAKPVKLTLSGIFNWSIDDTIKRQVQKFFLVSEETITNGLKSEVAQVVRIVVGQNGFRWLIDNGEILQLLVLAHLIEPDAEVETGKPGVKKLAVGLWREIYSAEENKAEPEKCIEELNAHLKRVDVLRKKYTKADTSSEEYVNRLRSRIERRYGIYFRAVSIPDILYDEKTGEALQLEFQTQHQLEAADLERDWNLKTAAKYENLLPSEHRVYQANVLRGKASQQQLVALIPGLGEVITAVISKIAGKLTQDQKSEGE